MFVENIKPNRFELLKVKRVGVVGLLNSHQAC
jgi:hypothetical protein